MPVRHPISLAPSPLSVWHVSPILYIPSSVLLASLLRLSCALFFSAGGLMSVALCGTGDVWLPCWRAWAFSLCWRYGKAELVTACAVPAVRAVGGGQHGVANRCAVAPFSVPSKLPNAVHA